MEKFGPIILIELVILFGVFCYLHGGKYMILGRSETSKALNQSHHSARLRLIAYVKT